MDIVRIFQIGSKFPVITGGELSLMPWGRVAIDFSRGPLEAASNLLFVGIFHSFIWLS